MRVYRPDLERPLNTVVCDAREALVLLNVYGVNMVYGAKSGSLSAKTTKHYCRQGQNTNTHINTHTYTLITPTYPHTTYHTNLDLMLYPVRLALPLLPSLLLLPSLSRLLL